MNYFLSNINLSWPHFCFLKASNFDIFWQDCNLHLRKKAQMAGSNLLVIASSVRNKLHLVKKDTKLNQGFCLIKSSEIIFIFQTEFYLIIWLMTSLKNSEKILILKTWQLFFFWGIKTCFGILPLKWCFFRHENINIWSEL